MAKASENKAKDVEVKSKEVTEEDKWAALGKLHATRDNLVGQINEVDRRINQLRQEVIK